MSDLIMLVLNEPGQTRDVIDAWLTAGVSGLTIIHSTGLAHPAGRHGLRDDLPLFPSLAGLLQSREAPHHSLFAVAPDGFDVEALVEATEKVTGPLDEPDTGILLVVPVRQAWGLHRKAA